MKLDIQIHDNHAELRESGRFIARLGRLKDQTDEQLREDVIEFYKGARTHA